MNESGDDNLILARGITRIYGRGNNAVRALRGASLDITRGRSTAIIGKSGSGKSTLAHILATLDRPTSGKLVIDGVSPDDMPARKLNQLRNQWFGFVFQQFFMDPHATVLDNVMLPMEIAGVKLSIRRKRALEALAAVDLSDKSNVRATELSGGQKQRVCIARAIVNQPQIIFADEPTGNLDSKTSALIEDLLFKLNHERGITLVIVTHDNELANKCDRQVELHDGRIVACRGINCTLPMETTE